MCIVSYGYIHTVYIWKWSLLGWSRSLLFYYHSRALLLASSRVWTITMQYIAAHIFGWTDRLTDRQTNMSSESKCHDIILFRYIWIYQRQPCQFHFPEVRYLVFHLPFIFLKRYWCSRWVVHDLFHLSRRSSITATQRQQTKQQSNQPQRNIYTRVCICITIFNK